MAAPQWYSENGMRAWLVREYPGLEPLATLLAEHLQKAYAKGWEHGFHEGETKQAILEIQGRDRFLKDLKKASPV